MLSTIRLVISALFYHRFLNVVIRVILQNSATIPLIPECYITGTFREVDVGESSEPLR